MRRKAERRAELRRAEGDESVRTVLDNQQDEVRFMGGRREEESSRRPTAAATAGDEAESGGTWNPLLWS